MSDKLVRYLLVVGRILLVFGLLYLYVALVTVCARVVG